MRSYYKIWRKFEPVDPPGVGVRAVHYSYDPGDAEVFAFVQFDKEETISKLNQEGGLFATYEYLGNDPQGTGSGHGTTPIYDPWGTFIPYEDHPLN